jgi:HlyD family secretion protein
MTPLRWLALLTPVAALACGDEVWQTPALGTLERDRIELVAESNDPIAEIAVREGDGVVADQLLVRQDDTRLRAQLALAQGTRDQARARLAELERGPRAERITEARARLAGAESALAVARRELERARTLATQNFRSRSELDLAQGRHDEALARRNEARAALEALEDGTTREELDQARSALATAEAAVVDAEVRVQRLTVRAPAPGRIDALPFELGERPAAGAVVAVVLADTAPYARVYVPQPLRVTLTEGAHARVVVPGLEREFRGRLRTVSREASFTPYFALTQHDRSRLAYVAEVDLDPAEARELPTGVPVEVRFEPRTDVAERTDE